MKKTFLVIALSCFSLSVLFSQTNKNVLFIGNSYTYVNDLLSLTALVANSLGDSLSYGMVAPGGYTLEGHSTNTQTINEINSENWDYVVLQEQSQRPSFPPSQVASEVLPYAEILDSLIHENDSCSTTLFFMTWGRKNGDQQNCQFYPPICTYAGMQQRLRESYLLMGQMFGAEVAPVGAAWQQVRINHPTLELYDADESHPSMAGSYVAACVFYSSIFHKSPVGAAYPNNLTAADATILQQQANETVFDSLENWYIDTLQVVAQFDYDPTNEPLIQFHNHSLYAQHYFWDFGDGTLSYETHPSHTYSQAGSYEVTLFAFEGCETDTFQTTLNISVNSIDQHKNGDNLIKIYPIPAQRSVSVEFEDGGISGFSYLLTDLYNKELLSGKSEKSVTTIETQRLTPGVYLLYVSSGQKRYVKKLIKTDQ